MNRLFAPGYYPLTLRLLAFIVASLFLLAIDQQGNLRFVRTPFTTAVYPIQALVSSPFGAARGFMDDWSSMEKLRTENEQLKEESLLLHTRLLKFDALEQENSRLRGLLESSFKIRDHVLIAELLSINLVPYEHVVVVNQGSNAGAHPGQAVCDANGMVGQVLRVTPFSAEVMLITDPSHAIPVQINRNGVRTIAVGTGQTDRLALPYLSGNADVQVGDLLVTSGLGGVFPRGYPVATVTAVAAQKSTFAKVSAAPVAKLDRNRELLLISSDVDPNLPQLQLPSRLNPLRSSNAAP